MTEMGRRRILVELVIAPDDGVVDGELVIFVRRHVVDTGAVVARNGIVDNGSGFRHTHTTVDVAVDEVVDDVCPTLCPESASKVVVGSSCACHVVEEGVVAYVGTSVGVGLDVGCHVYGAATLCVVIGEEAARHVITALAGVVVGCAGIGDVHSATVRIVRIRRIAAHNVESVEHSGVVAGIGIDGSRGKTHRHNVTGVVLASRVLRKEQPRVRHGVVAVDVGSEHRTVLHVREVAADTAAWVIGLGVEIVGTDLSLVACKTSIHAHTRRQDKALAVGYGVVEVFAGGFTGCVALGKDAVACLNLCQCLLQRYSLVPRRTVGCAFWRSRSEVVRCLDVVIGLRIERKRHCHEGCRCHYILYKSKHILEWYLVRTLCLGDVPCEFLIGRNAAHCGVDLVPSGCLGLAAEVDGDGRLLRRAVGIDSLHVEGELGLCAYCLLRLGEDVVIGTAVALAYLAGVEECGAATYRFGRRGEFGEETTGACASDRRIGGVLESGDVGTQLAACECRSGIPLHVYLACQAHEPKHGHVVGRLCRSCGIGYVDCALTGFVFQIMIVARGNA